MQFHINAATSGLGISLSWHKILWFPACVIQSQTVVLGWATITANVQLAKLNRHLKDTYHCFLEHWKIKRYDYEHLSRKLSLNKPNVTQVTFLVILQVIKS